MSDATLVFLKRFPSSEYTVQAEATVLAHKRRFRFAQFVHESEVLLGAKGTIP